MRILISLVAMATLAGPALAAPRLKADIVVDSALVTLGDLVEDAGAMADKAVFRAPDLGRSGTVSAARIDAAAREHGLDIDLGTLDRVNVRRASRVVTPEDMEGALRDALVAGGFAQAPEDIEITLGGTLEPVHLPAQVTDPLTAEDLVLDARTGRFTARLHVPSEAGDGFSRALTGRAAALQDVPVAAREIARGTVIGPDDVAFERQPVTNRRTPVAAFDALVGKVAERRIGRGTPIETTDLGEPLLVKRNELVTLTYRTGRLTLTARGRALADGVGGSTVTVLNLQSKRVVEGKVERTGVVEVSPPAAALRLANAQ